MITTMAMGALLPLEPLLLLMILMIPVVFVFYILVMAYSYAVATFPKHYEAIHFSSIILAFDPSKSPHYKVVSYVRTPQMLASHLIQSEIYSSKTGTWRTLSAQPYPERVNVEMVNKIYCSGSVYWISEAGADSLYFNVDEERLEAFPGPPIGLKSSLRSLYFVLGGSEDHLHVIKVCRYTTSFDVYEMKTDHSGWFVKFKVDLAEVFQVFPQMTCNIHPLDVGYGYLVNTLSR